MLPQEALCLLLSAELIQYGFLWLFTQIKPLNRSCFSSSSCSSSSLRRWCQRWSGRRGQRSISCHDVPTASAAGWPWWRTGRELLLRFLLPQLLLPEFLSFLTRLRSARTRFCFLGLQPAHLLLPRGHAGGHTGWLWNGR